VNVQHAPAPWWATDSGVRNSGGYVVHTNSVQRYEGQDERYAREVAQREADKLLIAAAPELLAAAHEAESLLPHLADPDADKVTAKVLDALRAAIAKATGRAS
jgi:hypothetical protein